MSAVTAASKLLTAEDLADRWQFYDKTGDPNPKPIYRMVRQGVIPRGVVVPLGRYYRFRLEGIEAFERGELPGKGDP